MPSDLDKSEKNVRQTNRNECCRYSVRYAWQICRLSEIVSTHSSLHPACNLKNGSKFPARKVLQDRYGGAYAGATRRRVHLATVLHSPSGDRPGRRGWWPASAFSTFFFKIFRICKKNFLRTFYKYSIEINSTFVFVSGWWVWNWDPWSEFRLCGREHSYVHYRLRHPTLSSTADPR